MIKVEATADGGLKAQVDEAVLIRRGHLDVELVGPRLQYAGTVATYKIRVSNPGNAAAKNVEVTAMMPTGAEFVASHDGGQLAAEHGHVKWNLGSLGPGSEQILWLTDRAPLAAQTTKALRAMGLAAWNLRRESPPPGAGGVLVQMVQSCKEIPPGRFKMIVVDECHGFITPLRLALLLQEDLD